jgi:chromosome segregation ATPase
LPTPSGPGRLAVVPGHGLARSTRRERKAGPGAPLGLEWVCAALIDRDEALQRARADLENTRTLAANWEAEVASVRNDNRGLRSSLQEAQAQQRQAEERARALEQKAKEADDLRAALDAKVAALAATEGQLL